MHIILLNIIVILKEQKQNNEKVLNVSPQMKEAMLQLITYLRTHFYFLIWFKNVYLNKMQTFFPSVHLISNKTQLLMK